MLTQLVLMASALGILALNIRSVLHIKTMQKEIKAKQKEIKAKQKEIESIVVPALLKVRRMNAIALTQIASLTKNPQDAEAAQEARRKYCQEKLAKR